MEAVRVVAGSAEVAVAAALRAQNDAERKAAEAGVKDMAGALNVEVVGALQC